MGNGPHLSRAGNSNLLDVINNPSKHDIDSHEIRFSGDTGNLSWTIGAYIFEEDSVDSIDVPIFRGRYYTNTKQNGLSLTCTSRVECGTDC